MCSEEGAVRLDDGPTLNHGRVEICISGDWGTVCDTLWGVAEASVVCRELGYGSNEAELDFAVIDKPFLSHRRWSSYYSVWRNNLPNKILYFMHWR